jgi:hypothetical protein
VRLQDARDLPGASGHLERHPVVAPRLRANSASASGVVSIRPAERTTPSSTIATSQKSRCTSNPIDPADSSHLGPLYSLNERENQRANDNDRVGVDLGRGVSLAAGPFPQAAF